MTQFKLITTSPVKSSTAELWVAYGILGKSAAELDSVDFSLIIMKALKEFDTATLSEKGQALYRDVILRNDHYSGNPEDAYTQMDCLMDNIGQDYVDESYLMTKEATEALSALQNSVSSVEDDVAMSIGFLHFAETPETIAELFTHVITPVMKSLDPNLVILQATISVEESQLRSWVI